MVLIHAGVDDPSVTSQKSQTGCNQTSCNTHRNWHSSWVAEKKKSLYVLSGKEEESVHSPDRQGTFMAGV